MYYGRKWTHDKRAGLIREEGNPHYICRGFKKEDGALIAAAPEMWAALNWLKEVIPGFYGDCIVDGMIKLNFPGETIDAIMAALAKAEGK